MVVRIHVGNIDLLLTEIRANQAEDRKMMGAIASAQIDTANMLTLIHTVLVNACREPDDNKNEGDANKKLIEAHGAQEEACKQMKLPTRKVYPDASFSSASSSGGASAAMGGASPTAAALDASDDAKVDGDDADGASPAAKKVKTDDETKVRLKI